MNEVTFGELETQRAELLPARETLYTSIEAFFFDIGVDLDAALVEATNTSQALNVIAEDSSAVSEAAQTVNVEQ
jgi:hypothetical protein